MLKELYIEEYERLESEGIPEDKLGDMAMNAARDRFFAMCDAAKDRAKYRERE